MLVLALVHHCVRSSAFPGGAQSAFDTGPAWSLLVFLVTHNLRTEVVPRESIAPRSGAVGLSGWMGSEGEQGGCLGSSESWE